MKRLAALSASCFVALHAPSALAVTHRVAVIVGNNAGAGEMRPLRFAQDDAGKIARVLAEVGKVSADDLFLLQGQTLESIRRALGLAKERVNAFHQVPADRVLLIFYFSGHSDGVALEIGGERLTFAELRELLGHSGAEVKVAIVDSCRSGALLAAKGGTAGPGFNIRLSDELASSGQVFLTSSASDEVALESSELAGSVFTHYLASGLRGAADSVGDGRVTLAEAYNYAYRRTLASTAATAYGAQHPAYDYRLSGQGELVLAELGETGGELASLQVPDGFSSAAVRDLRRDQVVAELGPGAGRKLAVEPGAYVVQAVKDGQSLAGRVELASGEQHVMAWADLRPVDAATGQAKGSGGEVSVAVTPDPPVTLGVSLGVVPGVAEGLGAVLPAIQVDMAGRDGNGLRVSVSAATGNGTTASTATVPGSGFNESAIRASLGYRFGWLFDRFGVSIGPAVAGGVVWQSTGGSSALGGPAIEGGLSFQLDRRVAIELDGRAEVDFLREDSSLGVVFVPGAWLGARIGLGD